MKRRRSPHPALSQGERVVRNRIAGALGSISAFHILQRSINTDPSLQRNRTNVRTCKAQRHREMGSQYNRPRGSPTRVFAIGAIKI